MSRFRGKGCRRWWPSAFHGNSPWPACCSSLHSPVLGLLPERNALNAVLQADLSGPVLKQAYGGHLNLDFALRYEPTDRTLRAHQIKVNSLVINDLAPP